MIIHLQRLMTRLTMFQIVQLSVLLMVIFFNCTYENYQFLDKTNLHTEQVSL